MYSNQLHQYKQQSLNTMTQGELLLALYDGSIKNLKLAQIQLDSGLVKEATTSLEKSQDIIVHLNMTLNMDYQVSEGLRHLYNFMYDHLQRAKGACDTTLVGEIIDMLVELRDTFREAARITKEQNRLLN